MPAKTAQLDAKFFPDDEAEYEVEHNPGLDFLRMLIQCTEAPPKKFNSVFAACSRNPIAVLLGAAALKATRTMLGITFARTGRNTSKVIDRLRRSWNMYFRRLRRLPNSQALSISKPCS